LSCTFASRGWTSAGKFVRTSPPGDAVDVAVSVAVDVGVSVPVTVAVALALALGVGDGVPVAVVLAVAVAEGEPEAVAVRLGLGEADAVAVDGTVVASSLPHATARAMATPTKSGTRSRRDDARILRGLLCMAGRCTAGCDFIARAPGSAKSTVVREHIRAANRV
jgi:hypothetical protein